MFGEIISQIKGPGFFVMERIEPPGLEIKLVTMGARQPFNPKL